MQQTSCNRQHATDNMQQTTCNRQRQQTTLRAAIPDNVCVAHEATHGGTPILRCGAVRHALARSHGVCGSMQSAPRCAPTGAAHTAAAPAVPVPVPVFAAERIGTKPSTCAAQRSAQRRDPTLMPKPTCMLLMRRQPSMTCWNTTYGAEPIKFDRRDSCHATSRVTERNMQHRCNNGDVARQVRRRQPSSTAVATNDHRRCNNGECAARFGGRKLKKQRNKRAILTRVATCACGAHCWGHLVAEALDRILDILRLEPGALVRLRVHARHHLRLQSAHSHCRCAALRASCEAGPPRVLHWRAGAAGGGGGRKWPASAVFCPRA